MDERDRAEVAEVVRLDVSLVGCIASLLALAFLAYVFWPVAPGLVILAAIIVFTGGWG